MVQSRLELMPEAEVANLRAEEVTVIERAQPSTAQESGHRSAESRAALWPFDATVAKRQRVTKDNTTLGHSTAIPGCRWEEIGAKEVRSALALWGRRSSTGVLGSFLLLYLSMVTASDRDELELCRTAVGT